MPPRCLFHGASSSKPAAYQGEYGTPSGGSLTEFRGRKASEHVGREVADLCEIIERLQHRGDGEEDVTFGDLFAEYETISNKLCGLLLIARRHGLVAFPGEMLFQGSHSGVVIQPLVSAEHVRMRAEAAAVSSNQEWGSSLQNPG